MRADSPQATSLRAVRPESVNRTACQGVVPQSSPGVSVMKRTAFALAFATVLAVPAFADQALANARNCMTCHAVDKDILGPSFRKVAAKYANDKGAADRLAVKIVKGGGGVWGTAVMPANTQVNEAESKRRAACVLAQK